VYNDEGQSLGLSYGVPPADFRDPLRILGLKMHCLATSRSRLRGCNTPRMRVFENNISWLCFWLSFHRMNHKRATTPLESFPSSALSELSVLSAVLLRFGVSSPRLLQLRVNPLVVFLRLDFEIVSKS
jgi:hypothetical protein